MKQKPQRKTIFKIIGICFLFVLVFALVLSLSPTVFADAGNNNRYDTSSSSSSSSDGDSYLLNWIIYFLFEMFGPLPGIILCIILLIVFGYLKKTGKLKNIQNSINSTITSNYSESFNQIVDNTISVSEQIRQIDPEFSSDNFLAWTREVFLKIQQAWTDRNWKVIRPFESNELFNIHNSQLNEYIKNHKINVVEKINISNATLREFRQDGDKEVLVVELHAVMRDYVIDEKTKKVLESNPNKDWYMKYLMTFNRKKGVLTKAGTSNKSTTNCPNCGAPTEITSSGQCEYCDSVITTGEHDWILSDIHSIK
ncbi:hypothetical protein EGW03_06780 [bacterium]|nr:hypothetical protein [bacterium]